MAEFEEVPELLRAALAAAVAGDEAGARLAVDLIPGSQLRPSLAALVVASSRALVAHVPTEEGRAGLGEFARSLLEGAEGQ